jgi:hypothetical protein
MIKQIALSTAILVGTAGMTFAGGKGGTELALASYGGLGVVGSLGIPLDIKFLRANGIGTYGEIELGGGFGNDIALGAELSGGLLIGIAPGISFYGSLGPAIGIGNDATFGLGAEVGLNIDVNSSSIVIEAGTHPASNYIGVGLRF